MNTHARLTAGLSVTPPISAAATGCGSEDDTGNAADPATVGSSTSTGG